MLYGAFTGRLWILLGLLLIPSQNFGQERPASSVQSLKLGEGSDWAELGEHDFQMVNGELDTWIWDGRLAKCTGLPVGVTRSTRTYRNFELIASWRHLSSGGNSGIFVWAPGSVLENLPKGSLPSAGIEIQVLDHGYTEQYEKSTGQKADWFTTHGDVFPVGSSKMKPFAPVAPGGDRSFPRENHSKPTPEWNQYYVRCLNGEVRLWVNGIEVSGGRECQPAEGFLCLESEGAPVEFFDLRLRDLP